MMVLLVMNLMVLTRRKAKAVFVSLIDKIIKMAELLKFAPVKQFIVALNVENRVFQEPPNAVFAAAHVVNLPANSKKPERVLEFVEKNRDLIFDMTHGGRLASR